MIHLRQIKTLCKKKFALAVLKNNGILIKKLKTLFRNFSMCFLEESGAQAQIHYFKSLTL